QKDSGSSSPQLGITKTGDAYLRKLLVNCAHYIIGKFGADSDLRRFGLRLAARGGKNAKKRAAVAGAGRPTNRCGIARQRRWVETGEMRTSGKEGIEARSVAAQYQRAA